MRALVVEDDKDLNRQLVTALSDAGHETPVPAVLVSGLPAVHGVVQGIAWFGPSPSSIVNNALAHLSAPVRSVLYLSFYARLNVRQITCVLQASMPDLRPEEVVRWLGDAWQAVLV